MKGWNSYPEYDPVYKGQGDAKPRPAVSTGKGPAPSLFSGLSPFSRGPPPHTLIPQASRARSHSHGTPFALPIFLLPPRDTKGHPKGHACKASWIFWRQREYFCRICRRCSSSSRCRMRRKLCSSGMLKASHCKWAEERYMGYSKKWLSWQNLFRDRCLRVTQSRIGLPAITFFIPQLYLFWFCCY